MNGNSLCRIVSLLFSSVISIVSIIVCYILYVCILSSIVIVKLRSTSLACSHNSSYVRSILFNYVYWSNLVLSIIPHVCCCLVVSRRELVVMRNRWVWLAKMILSSSTYETILTSIKWFLLQHIIINEDFFVCNLWWLPLLIIICRDSGATTHSIFLSKWRVSC